MCVCVYVHVCLPLSTYVHAVLVCVYVCVCSVTLRLKSNLQPIKRFTRKAQLPWMRGMLYKLKREGLDSVLWKRYMCVCVCVGGSCVSWLMFIVQVCVLVTIRCQGANVRVSPQWSSPHTEDWLWTGREFESSSLDLKLTSYWANHRLPTSKKQQERGAEVYYNIDMHQCVCFP